METHKQDRDFEREILLRIRKRNQYEIRPWEGIIRSHQRLLEASDNLKAGNVQLTVEIEKLRVANQECNANPSSNSSSTEKLSSLEQKIFKLQEEITDLHRRKGENADLLIQLSTSDKAKEAELDLAKARLSELKIATNSLSQKKSEFEKTVCQKDKELRFIREEHTDLLKAHHSFEQAHKQVKQDCDELIQRWVQVKQDQIDELNKINECTGSKTQAPTPEKNPVESSGSPSSPENDFELIEEDNGPGRVSGTQRWTIPPPLFSDGFPTKALFSWEAHQGEINAAKFGTGTLLATGGSDCYVKLWNVFYNNCIEIGRLEGSNKAVMSLDIDYSAKYYVSGSNDWACRIWTSDRRLRHVFTGHSDSVFAVKFLANDGRIVSGSRDRTIKVWDTTNGACVRTMNAPSSCSDLICGGLFHRIISGHVDGKIRFWDMRSDKQIHEVALEEKITSVDFSQDGQLLLVCQRNNILKVLDTSNNKVITELRAEEFRVAAAYSRAVFHPNGRYAAAGSQDGSVFIWNTAKGTVETVLKEHKHAVIACTWHPQGGLLATTDRSKKAILWGEL